MRLVFSRSKRVACPLCGSGNLQRSRRRGLLESIVFAALQIKPYRCISCDARHYRYRPSGASTRPVPSAFPLIVDPNSGQGNKSASERAGALNS